MIIGVTGSICAGIDLFGEILHEYDFHWLSYSDIIREEAEKKGLPQTRKILQDLGDQLRREEGNGVLSKRLISKMNPNKNYAVGNIRNPGEVEELRKKYGKQFVLVMLDAPLPIRFERLMKRARPGDPHSLEDFKKVEQRDLGMEQENYGQQHAVVFTMAEKVIINDKSEKELREKVNELLTELNIKI